MSRKSKGIYLYDRPAIIDRKTGKIRKRAVIELIDDGEVIARFPAEDRARAEQAQGERLIVKHNPARRLNQALENILVTDVLAIYATDVVPGLKRPEKSAQRIQQLSVWWVGKTLAEVTGRACRDYLKHREKQPWKSAKPGKTGNAPRMMSPAGVRRELEDLAAAIGHHHSEGHHREIIKVWLPPRGKKRERWLRRGEAARLLLAMWRRREIQVHARGPMKGEAVATRKRIWRHLSRFLLIALYTGSRSGVVVSASFRRGPGRAHVDLTTGLMHRLPEDENESANKLRPTIPVPERLLAHMRRWHRLGTDDFLVQHDGKPVKEVSKAFGRAVREAALEAGVTPHILRHTTATWLMLLGCQIREAAWYLGMSEKMLEERYGHYHPAFQAEVRARLDGKQAPNVIQFPVAAVFGASNVHKARAA
ncbi:tyrosine-type recombinase/integrase [Methylobacterium sp. Leaf88]|uniref:tyrosine-type recombinase/integrase n=1 Tax=Methylobacterium sp. Leaf88 TaxID=1736244 RepID=UPI0006F4C103|nr:tyrosine-type recombinase/integrase [Methylobacterium sp. Leaf88]KQO76348.1 hypothetical protein ASF20_13420 [Methylobacterium sp. Leaf88]